MQPQFDQQLNYPYKSGDEDLDYVEQKLLVAINRSSDSDECLELNITLNNYRRDYKQ